MLACQRWARFVFPRSVGTPEEAESVKPGVICFSLGPHILLPVMLPLFMRRHHLSLCPVHPFALCPVRRDPRGRHHRVHPVRRDGHLPCSVRLVRLGNYFAGWLVAP